MCTESRPDGSSGPLNAYQRQFTRLDMAKVFAECAADADGVTDRSLDDITAEAPFEAHAGWIGHVEQGAGGEYSPDCRGDAG